MPLRDQTWHDVEESISHQPTGTNLLMSSPWFVRRDRCRNHDARDPTHCPPRVRVHARIVCAGFGESGPSLARTRPQPDSEERSVW